MIYISSQPEAQLMHFFSQDYLNQLARLFESFPHDQFERMIEALERTLTEDRKIFTMGNGGSASTASHWACDLNKGCSRENKKRFKMLCLSDSIPTTLAYANDNSYDDIFVEQLKNFFRRGDVVIGISGSGNSANVLKAIDYANANGGTTVGLCGFSGGKLYEASQIKLLIRINDMQMAEDMHMVIAHMAMKRLSEYSN